jgi:hypothetical protein
VSAIVASCCAAVIKALVLVPLRDNSGKAFGWQVLAELEARLLELTGGVSQRSGVAGVWSDGVRRYRDRSNEYTVALASWRQAQPFLDIVDWARVRFAQEAMYIEINGAPEILGSP